MAWTEAQGAPVTHIIHSHYTDNLSTRLTFLFGLGGGCGLEPERSKASVDVSMETGSSWVWLLSMDPVESALTLARGTTGSSLVGLPDSWSLVVDARLKGFYSEVPIALTRYSYMRKCDSQEVV